MKKVLVILVVLIFAAGLAMAQGGSYAPTTDVLGAHNNHGRGCAGCHAPHSGPRGNGLATTDPSTKWVALWGQDVQPLYGQSFGFGDNGTSAIFVAPSDLSGDSHLGGSDPRVGGLLLCLSCHDGNLAKGTMMTNQVFETLPAGYGPAANIPTLLGNDKTSAGYSNDHPVGENAIIGCTGQYNWDCSVVNGTIQMTGTYSSIFKNTNYGFTASPKAYNGNPIVVCTSCHNQHVMNVYKGTIANVAGTYKTYFGVRGNYNPGSQQPGFNATAQFCRQCHGGEANELNNATGVKTVTGDD